MRRASRHPATRIAAAAVSPPLAAETLTADPGALPRISAAPGFDWAAVAAELLAAEFRGAERRHLDAFLRFAPPETSRTATLAALAPAPGRRMDPAAVARVVGARAADGTGPRLDPALVRAACADAVPPADPRLLFASAGGVERAAGDWTVRQWLEMYSTAFDCPGCGKGALEAWWAAEGVGAARRRMARDASPPTLGAFLEAQVSQRPLEATYSLDLLARAGMLCARDASRALAAALDRALRGWPAGAQGAHRGVASQLFVAGARCSRGDVERARASSGGGGDLAAEARAALAACPADPFAETVSRTVMERDVGQDAALLRWSAGRWFATRRPRDLSAARASF